MKEHTATLIYTIIGARKLHREESAYLMVTQRSRMKVRSNTAMASFRDVFSSSEACCAAPSLLPSSMCVRSYSSTCVGEGSDVREKYVSQEKTLQS